MEKLRLLVSCCISLLYYVPKETHGSGGLLTYGGGETTRVLVNSTSRQGPGSAELLHNCSKLKDTNKKCPVIDVN